MELRELYMCLALVGALCVLGKAITAFWEASQEVFPGENQEQEKEDSRGM